MNWKDISINNTETGFLYNDEKIFGDYKRVMSFHEEGLSAIYDDSGAYHINLKGTPIYSERYNEVFGYYSGIATVKDNEGYFHLDTKGNKIHNKKFKWSGNFQEDRCVVSDSEGFFHINKFGEQVYDLKYKYTGDFKYGIAVAYDYHGGCFHIDKLGEKLNNTIYQEAGVYHKGFAVVKDHIGFYHVDKDGNELYKYRFKNAEVFYNGWALCEDFDGKKIRISENGIKIYLKEYNEKLEVNDILKLIDEGKKIAIFIRHAERYEDKNNELVGEDVLLTENGKNDAQKLGDKLKEIEDIFYCSSPINRCIETLENVGKGAGKKIDINTSTKLGRPGVYYNMDSDIDSGIAMKQNGFINYSNSYLFSGSIIGSKRLDIASEELKEYFLNNFKAKLNIFCSHDFLIAAFMRFTGVRFPDKYNYVDYLTGIAIIFDEDKVHFYEFIQ